MPWRQGILDHHQDRPSSADRGEFTRRVVAELIAEADGKCQCGCGKPDQETHHVKLRSQSGRGVKSNGMRLNSECHRRIHANDDELRYWIEIYRQRHGEYFWFDCQDWDEHRRKQTEKQAQEEAKRSRQEIINLLSATFGRKARAKEKQFVASLNEQQKAAFVGMLQDLNQTYVRGKPFGYGHFED